MGLITCTIILRGKQNHKIMVVSGENNGGFEVKSRTRILTLRSIPFSTAWFFIMEVYFFFLSTEYLKMYGLLRKQEQRNRKSKCVIMGSEERMKLNPTGKLWAQRKPQNYPTQAEGAGVLMHQPLRVHLLQRLFSTVSCWGQGSC